MNRRIIALAAALLVLLCGCRKKAPEPVESPSEPAETIAETAAEEASETAAETAEEPDTAAVTEATAAATETTAATDATAEETEAQPSGGKPADYQGIKQPDKPLPDRSAGMIYREALENLRDHEIFPDGSGCRIAGSMDDNRFAVYDIDGDGRDELIIRFDQAAESDQIELIYGINDRESLFEELVCTPHVTYYEGGLVRVEAAPSDGYRGDFKPFAVYQYDSQSDTFGLVANVDALSLGALMAAGLEDEAYPEDADTSGSGMVYYIGSDHPVDVTEYEAWYHALFDGAVEIELPFFNLDENAVSSLE
ncbi:MAG: hypothetical protein IKN55_10740 [Oscillospiraceae bacterium]|nr:hypothetical protein [Oscillospiraceae bacterium]